MAREQQDIRLHRAALENSRRRARQPAPRVPVFFRAIASGPDGG